MFPSLWLTYFSFLVDKAPRFQAFGMSAGNCDVPVSLTIVLTPRTSHRPLWIIVRLGPIRHVGHTLRSIEGRAALEPSSDFGVRIDMTDILCGSPPHYFPWCWDFRKRNRTLWESNRISPHYKAPNSVLPLHQTPCGRRWKYFTLPYLSHYCPQWTNNPVYPRCHSLALASSPAHPRLPCSVALGITAMVKGKLRRACWSFRKRNRTC